VKDAQTYSDYISYDMEMLRSMLGACGYMRGWRRCPTKTGIARRPVIVNVPVNGIDEASVRANAWMFQAGACYRRSRCLLTHADDPGAVRGIRGSHPISHSQTGA